jgi:hypothetical protein
LLKQNADKLKLEWAGPCFVKKFKSARKCKESFLSKEKKIIKMRGLRSALLPVAATASVYSIAELLKMCDQLVTDFLLYRLGILDDV